jgi:glycosyltransferase involved in cell wall biosynthesis
VAGGGPSLENFRNEARSRGLEGAVAFTGSLTPREVASCLRAADVALVYYSEGLANRYRASLKLREALACGAKVVSTNVGEASSMGKYVTLSKPDPVSFAQAIDAAWRGRTKPFWRGPTWDEAARILEVALHSC